MPDIIAIVVIIAAFVFWIKSVQRSIAVLDENINNAISQIGVQLSSQWDSISYLLGLVKGYDTQEYETLKESVKARRSVIKKSTNDDIEIQEKTISAISKKIMETAESYPDLNADKDYIKSMDAVNQFGKMINTSNLIYNESVTRLNLAVCMFPSSMIAGFLGFSKRAFLKEVDDGS